MINLPRVNPVGVSEVPAEYSQQPRQHVLGHRTFAAALAFIFTAVVLGTGVASLASWCLTSNAGSPLFALQ